MSRLDALGWAPDDPTLAEIPAGAEPARVAIEHQDRYTVVSARDQHDVHLSGRLLADAARGGLRPAVGDWVCVSADTVAAVLPRRTALRRLAPGDRLRAQVVAANIDVLFIVTSCNREFRERRLERYLVSAHDSGARPVLVVNKADLATDSSEFIERAKRVAGGVDVHAVSATRGDGLEALQDYLRRGVTAALVGSSGVGKSTIGNWLLGSEQLSTAPVREEDDKGRHTTTRRELLLLPEDRGVLIDTPGMRELQLWLDDDSLLAAFPDVARASAECRFRDCHHDLEPGCAVRDGVADDRLQSYRRLRAELDELRERRTQGRR